MRGSHPRPVRAGAGCRADRGHYRVYRRRRPRLGGPGARSPSFTSVRRPAQRPGRPHLPGRVWGAMKLAPHPIRLLVCRRTARIGDGGAAHISRDLDVCWRSARSSRPFRLGVVRRPPAVRRCRRAGRLDGRSPTWPRGIRELQFGHTVLCQSFRNPALLAKMAATLQFLSGGRFILGLGAGWHEEEYRAYGYDFPPAGRARGAAGGDDADHQGAVDAERRPSQGKHYQRARGLLRAASPTRAADHDRRVQAAHAALTARHADWWNVSWTGIADYRRRWPRFERACAEVGRDPATLRRTWFGGCACAPTQAAGAKRMPTRRADPDSENFAFVGTPRRSSSRCARSSTWASITSCSDCGGFPELTTLELLVDEVLPALNGSDGASYLAS